MKNIFSSFLVTVLAFLISPAIAFSAAADDIAAKLQSRYESIETITAGFKQESVQKAFGIPQVSEGKVTFKKPGKMRWQYSSPTRDELVSDGKTLWLWQPDLNQVVERPAKNGGGLATDFLSGIGNIGKEFDFKLSGETDAEWRLLLTPKTPQPGIKSLTVEIDKANALVKRTVVQDQFGNETRVSFKEIKVNPPVKDSVFEFKAPKGANRVAQ